MVPSEDLSPGSLELSAGSEGHILLQLYLHKVCYYNFIVLTCVSERCFLMPSLNHKDTYVGSFS